MTTDINSYPVEKRSSFVCPVDPKTGRKLMDGYVDTPEEKRKREEWVEYVQEDIEAAVENFIYMRKLPRQDKDEWVNRTVEELLAFPRYFVTLKWELPVYPLLSRTVGGLVGDYLAAHPEYGWELDKESGGHYTTYHRVQVDQEKLGHLLGGVDQSDDDDEMERRAQLLELQQTLLELVGAWIRDWLGEDHYLVWELSRVTRSNVEIHEEIGLPVDQVQRCRENALRFASTLKVAGVSLRKFWAQALEDLNDGLGLPEDWTTTCRLEDKITPRQDGPEDLGVLAELLGEEAPRFESEEEFRARRLQEALELLAPKRRESSDNRPEDIRDDEVTSREAMELLGHHIYKYRNPWSQLKHLQKRGEVLVTRAFGEGNTRRYYYHRDSILQLKDRLDSTEEGQIAEDQADKLLGD